ncbi:MAG: class I SAM-dependent methyltransferase [Alcanivorax sp.]|nr:class I SAM-dependent methyltransferase [Alcanivorax sp.]
MTQPTVDTLFEHALASLRLRRYPRLRGETLRAWDGADLYLLDEYGRLDAPAAGAPLVLNDQCGALTLALHACGRSASAQLCSSGDSWLAQAALQANASDNGLVLPEGVWRWPLDAWPEAPSVVLVRVPKEMALLEAQLSRLGSLPAGTPVRLAWMDKHLPGGLVDRVRHYLGPVNLLRGAHKAHGLQAEVPAGGVPAAPYPTRVAVPEQGWSLTVHAGVFAQQQLDIGARLFMASVPKNVTGPMADLGCGNGVIGMMAARRNPGLPVTFCDESWLALQSARENMQACLPDETAHFHLGNGLAGLTERFALILLNPPFHRGHAVDDTVAKMLFRQAADRLLPGGVLQVIGNRHLRYDRTLQRHFPKVRQIGGDSRFVILAASR